jgi:opacity protein-like surface antigen
MRKLLAALFIFFMSIPFVVYAQDYTTESNSEPTIKNTFGFGPRAGYYIADDAEDGSFYGGIQARFRMGAVVGLEGAVEYRTAHETNFEFGDVSQSVDTKFVPITASLLLFLPVSPYVAPYGIGGAGAYYTIYDYDGNFLDENDDEFNFGYHLGFGLEFPFNNNIALNLDYRYLFLNPDEGETTLDEADYNFDGNAFTASLMFYF